MTRLVINSVLAVFLFHLLAFNISLIKSCPRNVIWSPDKFCSDASFRECKQINICLSQYQMFTYLENHRVVQSLPGDLSHSQEFVSCDQLSTGSFEMKEGALSSYVREELITSELCLHSCCSAPGIQARGSNRACHWSQIGCILSCPIGMCTEMKDDLNLAQDSGKERQGRADGIWAHT